MTVPETPCDVELLIACPLCHRLTQATMEVKAKVTATTDSEDETAVKLSAAGQVKPFFHVCGQMTISEVE